MSYTLCFPYKWVCARIPNWLLGCFLNASFTKPIFLSIIYNVFFAVWPQWTSLFWSWDQTTVVPLYGVSKAKWAPCMAFVVPGAKPIWCIIIFWIMGSKQSGPPVWSWVFVWSGIKHSGLPVWLVQNTAGALHGVLTNIYCPGPSQSEVASYVCSWDQNTLVPLCVVSKTQ